MKHFFSFIIGLSIFSSFICEGAGIVAWKEQSFHKDSLANVATYRQKKFSGYEGVFNIKGKDVYLSSGQYWFIELPNSLPLELSDSIQYEDLLRKKGEMSAFLERFSKSSPVLDPWLKKLQEYQDKYDSGKYLVNGAWIEKSAYEQEQVALKEKMKQRRLKEQKEQKPYVDGFLQKMSNGSFDDAKTAIRRLEQASKVMDESGRNLAQQLIQSINRLFAAQISYKNALEYRVAAKTKAEQYERQADADMKPSPLTGKPNTYMADSARKKARKVIMDAEHALANGKRALIQSLKQSDTLACSLYKNYPRDAESLASAVKVIIQSCDGEISFEHTKVNDCKIANVTHENGRQTRRKEEEEIKMEQSSPDERLIYGIEKNLEAWVHKALKDGANVNGKNDSGSPLFAAVRVYKKYNSMTIIQLLIEKGARMDIRSNGDTPFFVNEDSELREYFISKGYIPDPLEIEARRNRRHCIGTVIQILQNGVLLEVGSILVFAQFDALLPAHQINQTTDEKKAISEGDICSYYYSSSSRFQYTSTDGVKKTIPLNDVLKRTIHVNYNMNNYYIKGKVIQVLENGMLAFMEIRDGLKYPDRRTFRIIYIESHPHMNRICDNDNLSFDGERTGVFIYKDVNGNERIVPKVKCIKNFLQYNE